MNNKKQKEYILLCVLLGAFTCLVFFKIFLKGLYPVPTDLLVSFYFPWYSGGWEGYNSWTAHKEFIASDAIRQHLPWLKLTFENIFDNFTLPLWNPYNFSGAPHLANIQTLVFNPFTLLFLVLPFFYAWNLFIIIQIPLAILFTYLFAKSLGLSKIASIFSALGFVFSSYFLIWFEIGIVGHTILWFPLILYLIQKYFENLKLRYVFILILVSVICIFSGHIQSQLYIFSISSIYFLLKSRSSKPNLTLKKSMAILLFWLVSVFLISAIQLFPTFELYKLTPLTESLSKESFKSYTMPYQNLITLLAPDFFGSPATHNFWSTQYGDGTPNIGILPFFFAIAALFKLKRWEFKYFAIITLIFALLALRSPLYLIINYFQIPFVTSTSPVRSMFVFCFFLSILAGWGIDDFIKANKKQLRRYYLLMAIFTIVFVSIVILTMIIPIFVENKDIWSQRLFISQKNLILPFIGFLSLPLVIILNNKFLRFKIKTKNIVLANIFFVTIFLAVYQFNKIEPFSPKQNFFPEHPMIVWLQKNGSINRFYGTDTAKFANNFASYYKVHSAEGYSVLRVKRYAELLASQDSGNNPTQYNRADAEWSDKNEFRKKRLLNLIGVKYQITKDDQSRDATIKDEEKPNDDVKLEWQNGKFKIYQRNNSLPRFFLTSDYIVANSDQDILENIYDENFNLKTIILEKSPSTELGIGQSGSVDLLSYKPNKIIFKTDTEANTLLFLSDTDFPGWIAKIDNKRTEILRADYAFRAIVVPKGEHSISFEYQPKSFYIGAIVSIISLIIISIYGFLTFKNKRM